MDFMSRGGLILNVAILMSTYNGEKYIDAQIESIFKQVHCSIDLYVRDDGSTDNTVMKIKKWNDKRIHIIAGKNIGTSRSFCELLFSVPIIYDYYAFADQDDIWRENKLIKAIEKLEGMDDRKPNLYYSALKCVDNEMHFIKFQKIGFPVSFEFSLIRSVFPGCTMVFNKETLLLLKDNHVHNQIMHDQFVYQVVSGVNGDIIYDNESFINYRLHGNNVSDFSSYKKRLIKLKNDFGRNKNSRWKALKELKENYDEKMTKENKELLEKYCGYIDHNFCSRFKIGISIPDTLKYKCICAISMLFKKF